MRVRNSAGCGQSPESYALRIALDGGTKRPLCSLRAWISRRTTRRRFRFGLHPWPAGPGTGLPRPMSDVWTGGGRCAWLPVATRLPPQLDGRLMTKGHHWQLEGAVSAPVDEAPCSLVVQVARTAARRRWAAGVGEVPHEAYPHLDITDNYV